MEIEELFESYLGDKMSESDRALFEKLLKENPHYESQLKNYQHFKIQLDPHSNPPGLLSQTKNIKYWSISIGIGLLIVLVGYFLFTTLSMSPGQKLYAKHYNIYPNEVPASILGEDELGLRSEAFQAYDAGNFEKAAELFEQIQAQPNSDFALLFHGICQLELGRPEKAIPLLSLIPADSKTASKEVASWYEALGYFKLNMLDKGKKSLQIAAAKSNPYQAQAKTILDSLK